jgi:hypothetical protein
MKRSIFLFFILLVVGQVRAEEGLQNPIAFSRDDGNIYLWASEISYPVTSDASASVSYSNPQWSADGQTLAFMRRENELSSIFIAPSGEAPRLLVDEEIHGVYFTAHNFAVAPDGSAVAFFGWTDAETGIFVADVASGDVRFIATAQNSAIGEAGEFYDPAEAITLAATGSSMYRDQFALRWGEYGILHTPAPDSWMALTSPEGESIWEYSYYSRVLFDAEGKHAAGLNYPDQWDSIDVATGEVSPLELPEGAKPLGWVGDEFFYRTRTELVRVAGDPLMAAGIEVFDYNWGFTATTAMLNIYLEMPDGEDELVASLEGYDIGFIEGVAINELLLYYVSSSVPAVMALNEGASAAEVEPLLADAEMIRLHIAYKEEQPNFVGRFALGSRDAVQSNGVYMIGG